MTISEGQKEAWERLRVDVMTVDACQGQERDMIIMSCVRASTGGLGFLQDLRRMNVALTRARFSLLILGNSESLLQSPAWRALLLDLYRRRRYYILHNRDLPPDFSRPPPTRPPAHDSALRRALQHDERRAAGSPGPPLRIGGDGEVQDGHVRGGGLEEGGVLSLASDSPPHSPSTAPLHPPRLQLFSNKRRHDPEASPAQPDGVKRPKAAVPTPSTSAASAAEVTLGREAAHRWPVDPRRSGHAAGGKEAVGTHSGTAREGERAAHLGGRGTGVEGGHGSDSSGRGLGGVPPGAGGREPPSKRPRVHAVTPASAGEASVKAVGDLSREARLDSADKRQQVRGREAQGDKSGSLGPPESHRPTAKIPSAPAHRAPAAAAGWSASRGAGGVGAKDGGGGSADGRDRLKYKVGQQGAGVKSPRGGADGRGAGRGEEKRAVGGKPDETREVRPAPKEAHTSIKSCQPLAASKSPPPFTTPKHHTPAHGVRGSSGGGAVGKSEGTRPSTCGPSGGAEIALNRAALDELARRAVKARGGHDTDSALGRGDQGRRDGKLDGKRLREEEPARDGKVRVPRGEAREGKGGGGGTSGEPPREGRRDKDDKASSWGGKRGSEGEMTPEPPSLADPLPRIPHRSLSPHQVQPNPAPSPSAAAALSPLAGPSPTHSPDLTSDASGQRRAAGAGGSSTAGRAQDPRVKLRHDPQSADTARAASRSEAPASRLHHRPPGLTGNSRLADMLYSAPLCHSPSPDADPAPHGIADAGPAPPHDSAGSIGADHRCATGGAVGAGGGDAGASGSIVIDESETGGGRRRSQGKVLAVIDLTDD